MKIKIESGANVQFTDKPIYNNFIFGDVVQQKVVQVEKGDNKKEVHPHFPLNNTKDEGIRLFNALTSENFMQATIDSWLFLMGFSDQEPIRINPIKWLCNKEQLRVMLRLIYDRLINENAYSWADIEKLTPHCFIDKKGNPMELAKAKEEPSQKTDRLREIIRPNTDL